MITHSFIIKEIYEYVASTKIDPFNKKLQHPRLNNTKDDWRYDKCPDSTFKEASPFE